MTSSKKSKVSLETITGYFVGSVGSQETENVATDVFVTSVIHIYLILKSQINIYDKAILRSDKYSDWFDPVFQYENMMKFDLF